MAATTTTLQVGTINFLSDTFTSVLDLNDLVTFKTQDVHFVQPERLYSEAFNMRTPGVAVQQAQYGNGAIRVRLFVQAANTTAILSAIHNLFAAVENPPYWLKVQLAGGVQNTYFQVLKVAKPEIPYQAQKYLSGFALGFDLTFTVAPKGITLPRQNLSNLINNPGYESVSNTGITVFSDPFTSVNAYAVQAGGAPTLSPSNTFVDVVMAQGGSSLLNYYRLGEGVGVANAVDIGGFAHHGTYVGPPTLGVAGGVSGDTDTAITLSGSGQYVDCPTSGLPSGNSAITLLCRFKFAANPAGNNWLMTYGNATGGSHNFVGLFLDSAGKLNASNGTSVTSAAAVTTGVYHTAALTWDGTTLTLYLDGASTGTPVTPGANTISAVTANTRFRIGATADTTAAALYTGQLDEAMVFNAAMSSTIINNIHAAANTGATGTVANAMSLPNGARVAFGSPAWAAINTWQVRFRWVSGLTAEWHVHYTDANNNLKFRLNSAGGISLVQTVGGVGNTLASATVVLTHEAWYWIRITQFPATAGAQCAVQALLFYDNAGALGAAVTSGAIGPVNTFDGATALIGRPQIIASGAALVIGGNFGSVHTVSLFGPGGWNFTPNSSSQTGQMSAAWEQNTSNTYPSGPVTSYGAARVDLPPAGSVDGRWQTWDGTGGAAVVAQSGLPTSQGHVLGFGIAYKTTAGLSATCQLRIVFREVNTSGSELLSTALTILNGTTATSWTSYSTTYTVQNAATAYVRLQLQIIDTVAGASANQTLWFDNAQLWDQTALGGQASMPYCELRTPNSPAQLLVSGLLGDAPAPAFVSLAAFFASWATNATAVYQLGRRAVATKGMRLIAPTIGAGQVLDTSAYGGYSCVANLGPLVYTAADELGIYHILGRAKSANGSPANNVWFAPDVPIFSLAIFTAGAAAPEYARWDGAKVYPIQTTNTWTALDAGQAILPASAYTNQTDLTQLVSFLSTTSGAISGGGSQLTVNWIALLPVDGGVASYGLANSGGGLGALTNTWLYLYSDGVRGVATHSRESSALPNPAVSGGLTNSLSWSPAGNSEPIITSGADSVLYLDPTTPSGVPSGVQTAAGANQFLLHATDGTAASLPVAVDLSYYPAYLFPR